MTGIFLITIIHNFLYSKSIDPIEIAFMGNFNVCATARYFFMVRNKLLPTLADRMKPPASPRARPKLNEWSVQALCCVCTCGATCGDFPSRMSCATARRAARGPPRIDRSGDDCSSCMRTSVSCLMRCSMRALATETRNVTSLQHLWNFFSTKLEK